MFLDSLSESARRDFHVFPEEHDQDQVTLEIMARHGLVVREDGHDDEQGDAKLKH